MPVLTLHVGDELANRLNNWASSCRQSVEDCALTILAEVLSEPEENPRWEALNRRRLLLIDKKYEGCLTAEEEVELKKLQVIVGQGLQAGDTRLLETLGTMEQEVAK